MSIITNFTIISAATSKLRGTVVQSYSDGTRESNLASILYPLIMARDLACHPWQFNTTTVQLAQLAGSPPDPNWQFQFATPFDMIAFHNAMNSNGADANYLIESEVLYCEFPAVYIKYQYGPPTITEADFPAYFVDLLISHLAWEFAIPLSGDGSLEQKFREEYQIKYKFAINTDGKANIPIPLISPMNSRYVRARFGAAAPFIWPVQIGN